MFTSAFSFEKHAETEGFGKMAKRMGFSVVGLPHYTIWHLYEPSVDDIRHMEEMEQERKAREKEENERREREEKINVQFDMEGKDQWEKDMAAVKDAKKSAEDAQKETDKKEEKSSDDEKKVSGDEEKKSSGDDEKSSESRDAVSGEKADASKGRSDGGRDADKA